MRYKVVFKSKTKKIPIGYRTLFASMFKKIIEETDEQYYNENYFYGEKKNKCIKDLNFSVYLDGFKLGEEDIEVLGDIILNITTADLKLGLILYNALLKLKEYTYKNIYTLEKVKFIKIKEKKVKDRFNVFKTLSPIYAKDINNKDLDIYDEDFKLSLNYISDIYLKKFRGTGLKEEIKFIPIKMKMHICKEELKDFTEKTGRKYICLKCYSGLFSLEGNAEDINILLQSGILYRRSFGFGMIELI